MVAEARFAGEGKGIGGNDLANLGFSGFGGGRTGARGRPGGGRRVGDSASWPAGRLFLFDPDVSVSGSYKKWLTLARDLFSERCFCYDMVFRWIADNTLSTLILG